MGISIGDQPVKLSYDTRGKVPEANGGLTMVAPSPASFGPMWQTNLHKSLVLQSSGAPGAPYSTVAMQRGGNTWATASVAGFDTCTSGAGGGGGSSYVATVEPALKLNYAGTAGQLLDARALTEENYDASGALTSLAQGRGGLLNYTYSDATTPITTAPVAGLLIRIDDSFGRAVRFTYEQPTDTGLAPRITTVTSATGQVIRADYDAAGNLIRLNWADGKVRTFVYENASLPWALTSIIDENNARHATYGYDAEGRANSTELAGGVDRYAVTYSAPPRWSVTEVLMGDMICREHRWLPPTGTVLSTPNGITNELGANTTQGMVGLTSQSQPAGSGCGASSTAQAYDANGNVSQFDNVNGNRTCYGYDTARNLRTISLEGLPTTAACPADLAGYAPSTADPSHPQRKTTTAWHPDWELQTRKAEPNKLTTYVYNGQPDPFSGGAAASCAPATALLPDGKPIAVLCKQVEQATTDATGALGFSAALQPGVPNRVQSWTYNQYGQVLTTKGPRTDVDDTTRYVYYTDTVFTGVDPDAVGHTIGDLQTMTIAVGKVTTFTKYNKAGQVLEMSDANGVLTVNTYDARQRLTSTSVGGQITRFGYDGVGQLKTTTLPNGAVITNTYDDAHRLTQVQDAAGNKVTYTLDNSGNRIGEEVKDAGGTLVKNIARSYDALNRLQSITGAVR